MSSLKTIVRVYGILIRKNRLLLCREKIKGKYYTKFPGGGLEFGEGIEDCIIREFEEETGASVKAGEIFYINPHFVPSAFHQQKQVLSIYYELELQSTEESVQSREEDLELIWVPIQEIKPEIADLPIDQEVLLKISRQLFQ